MMPYRVRFAPSPTGEMHLGGARTALFDYLLAKKSGGSFVLRIEDTDQHRKVDGAVEHIYEALQWLGIAPDEGPEMGGPYAPYVQSERLDLYRAAAQTLIEKKAAYYCFCSPDRLQKLRESQAAAKQPPRYDKQCLYVDAADAARRVAAGESHVVRLSVPEEGSISFTDRIRGEITFQYKEVDDSVLLKSDGYPTYHLAVVVDDHAMDINLVVRAEEWIPSTPKHLLVYAALGYAPPEYAHVPQILAKDRSKLSKRHGAVSVQEFRTRGYLPQALVNYFALLGWNPGNDREFFTLEELVQNFSLERVMKAGAIFDEAKLRWMNGKYIRDLSPEVLTEKLTAYIPETPASLNRVAAVRSVQDRLEVLSDAAGLMDFYIHAPKDIPADVLIHKKLDANGVRQGLAAALEIFQSAGECWTDAGALKTYAMADITKRGLTNMQVLWPTRVALTGRKASPDVFDVAVALGEQETLQRITAAQAALPVE